MKGEEGERRGASGRWDGGAGLCAVPAHTEGDGRLFVTPGPHSSPIAMGRSGPPSIPKPGEGITRVAGQGDRHGPHIQARFLYPPVPGAAVPAASCSPLHGKLRRRVMLSAPLGAQKPLQLPRVPPHRQREPARAARILGRVAGSAPGTAGTCTDHSSSTGGSLQHPKTSPSIPKRDVTPQGTRDTQGVLRRCSGGWDAGMKGMLERARGGAEDARGQHGGCSGQDRDAGAGLEGRTRDAGVMTGGP